MIATENTIQADRRLQSVQQGKLRRDSARNQNVGETDRAASVAAGALLAVLGLTRRSVPGFLLAGVGGALVYRGFTGHSYAYDALNVDTREGRGIRVEEAFLINRSPEELYFIWRDFERLPEFMTHLISVKKLDDTHWRWTAKAPGIAGGQTSWDAEIVRDEPNSLISWRTSPESTVQHSGEISFAKALGDRGTEVHVAMEYSPPAGYLGHLFATISGESPSRQLRDDLRNFKRLMETGEIATICGQPRGTCKR